eukprot:scaffold99685_cov29-Attheya_sp.AAC.1
MDPAYMNGNKNSHTVRQTTRTSSDEVKQRQQRVRVTQKGGKNNVQAVNVKGEGQKREKDT